MSRTLLPFSTSDISALARSLNGQLARHGSVPGHVELLNMLARSVGWRNFQHFRAAAAAKADLEAPPSAISEAPVDFTRVKRVTRHFDPSGRLIRWPSKFSEQQACLWVFWSRLPPRETMSERAVNAILTAHHHFGDHALLRRELVDGGWLVRSVDCREYRRVERQPPSEALALIRHLARRAGM